MVSRSLILFEESCKSEKTRESYRNNLNKFLKWSQKDYESLLMLSKTELEKKDEVIEELQEENRQMDARIKRLENTNS